MPPTLLHLEDRLTRLSIAPELGGGIANWMLKASGQTLLRPSDQSALDAGTPRRLACYPLAPWSNRIAGGGFDGPDGWLALTANSANDPLPTHGSAWQQPWQVNEQYATTICLQLHSQQSFAYRAQQRFSLADGRLSIELRVTHLPPPSARPPRPANVAPGGIHRHGFPPALSSAVMRPPRQVSQPQARGFALIHAPQQWITSPPLVLAPLQPAEFAGCSWPE